MLRDHTGKAAPSSHFAHLRLSSRDETGEVPCLLMFSGGRDSTLATLRLQARNTPLGLVTVTSGHLVGISRVKHRLSELARFLPPETEWLQVLQPADLRTDVSFYDQTCLPCHHAYVAVSGALARLTGVKRLGFGYTRYQSDWPEQTPLAISCLRRVLAKHDINLELPAHDIESRDAAIQELRSYGVSTDALEQKCIRQVTNVALDAHRLERQVALWEAAIDASMGCLDTIKMTVLTNIRIGDLR